MFLRFHSISLKNFENVKAVRRGDIISSMRERKSCLKCCCIGKKFDLAKNETTFKEGFKKEHCTQLT